MLTFLLSACGGGTIVGSSPSPLASALPQGSLAAGRTPVVTSPVTSAAVPSATPGGPLTAAPAATLAQQLAACSGDAPCSLVQDAINKIDPHRLNEHVRALTAVGSRDPRHAGHAKAVAYIKEQLGALAYYGWKIESHRTTYQGIPLENIFASIDGASAAFSGHSMPRLPPAPQGSWVLVSAHYDSIANRTPGWRPAVDPAPGADDNATGTAALLEFARIISEGPRESLRSRIVLAFFDGEELFYKGSAAYVQTLAKPYPYRAAINLDMVGFNPIADRLDLLWYTNGSAGLRDRVIAVEKRYGIGIQPLNPQAAPDGNTIMDAAPFGLAGIPSIALTQRYGLPDATHPGNNTFHTVNDTPDKITNPRLWLKAAKLTLAVALELATAPD